MAHPRVPQDPGVLAAPALLGRHSARHNHVPPRLGGPGVPAKGMPHSEAERGQLVLALLFLRGPGGCGVPELAQLCGCI